MSDYIDALIKGGLFLLLAAIAATAILASLRKQKPAEPLDLPKPWVGGVSPNASTEHAAMIEGAILRIAHRGARLKVEQDPRTGKWRAWLDAQQFELAVVRGEWNTRPGALRMVLRDLGPLGGLWLTLAIERQTEREVRDEARAAS